MQVKGKYIKEMITGRGYSLREFGKISRLSANTMTRMCKHNKCRFESLNKVATALNVDRNIFIDEGK